MGLYHLTSFPPSLSPLLIPNANDQHMQVLPGRTHPTMSTTGSGGFLLSTLKVIDCPAEAVGHGKKRAKSEEKAGEEQGPIVDTTEKKAKLE